jgi:membrane protein DedA with SNARE-associated domain
MGIVEFVSELIISMIRGSGYFGIFLAMAIESACLPFPSEVIMPFAGFIVSEGRMTLVGITLAGALGNLFGSLVAYVIGIAGGRPFLEKYGKYLLISKHKLELADKWFSKYGDKAVFISRVLPIIRTFISLPAGIARMDIKKFIAYTFVGSVPWCLFLGYLGVLLGPKWNILKKYFHILDAVIIAAVVGLIIYAIVRAGKKKAQSG